MRLLEVTGPLRVAAVLGSPQVRCGITYGVRKPRSTAAGLQASSRLALVLYGDLASTASGPWFYRRKGPGMDGHARERSHGTWCPGSRVRACSPFPFSSWVPRWRVHLPTSAFSSKSASLDEGRAGEALKQLAAAWKDDYAALVVDLVRLMTAPVRAPPSSDLEGPPRSSWIAAFDNTPETPPREPLATAHGPTDPSVRVRERLVRFLEKQTRQRFGHDLPRWRQWMWNRP